MSVLLQQFWDLIRRYPLVSSCVAVLLLLGAANYYFWDQRHTLARQHDEARLYGEAMLPVLASHTRLTAQVATTQEAVELIERNLVVESGLAENLGYFYKLETASRARLAQISQLNAQVMQGNPFKAVPFSLRVTGSYPQLIGFVRALETGPRLARIKDYDFTRSDAKAGTLALDMTVELLGNK
ncbi:MAG: type 4a pilus biogenesis protein PilO [Undibacterium sp.]|nr:type 4a pilus biogenesis protein PilO [Opitutaceae bacterium]